MKTRGFNFKEAVKAMRKKKKVKQNEMYGQTYLYLNEDGEIIHVGSDGSIDLACHTAIINWVTNDKFDWEVVDVDKDWCLKDRHIFSYSDMECIKNMCDLIIEDIKHIDNGYRFISTSRNEEILNVIKKRSGLYGGRK